MNEAITRSRIINALIAINTTIFLVLSLLHFYWGFGGSLWYEEVLPTNSHGSKRMEPGMIATLVVAFGLVLSALITLGNRGTWDQHIKRKYFRYGTLLITIIFLLRAIGDFKLVGFFKTITKTRFAENDTQFFSPLCLLIATVSLLLFALTNNEP